MLQKNAEQVWEKGFIEDCGYFTLKNPQSQKLLTAVSPHGFDIKGTKAAFIFPLAWLT